MYKVSAKEFLIKGTLDILAHEILCEEDELISRQFDRWLEKHPVLTTTATLLVASFTVGHILNWLPKQIDPYQGLKKGF